MVFRGTVTKLRRQACVGHYTRSPKKKRSMATLLRNLNLKVDWESQAHLKKHRLTQIVCTIGPKTKSPEMLDKMMNTGMNIMRLNFSHGSHEYHGEVIANLRTALAKRSGNARCAIMLDTKGPEIRTGKLKDKTIKLTAGQTINVSTDLTRIGDDSTIIVDYQDLCTSVKVGGHILIADGQISLTVTSINAPGKICVCTVNNTSVLGENKNTHLPGAKVNLPAVSEKDIQDLRFGVEQKVDMVAASFIRSAYDVLEIRKILGEEGKHIKIISKIESTEGLENFDSILAVSDGIMVARGDLGVELPMEQIFVAQKMMVSKCNAAGKPVITATQMLESMIQNPRPTRAEATDVANAVLDGTDAVMLSGETASGDYPLEAISYMSGICKEAESVEAATHYPTLFEGLRTACGDNITTSEVVASYAVRAANDVGASLVITVSETGATARLACKYRPKVPVICVTHHEHVANTLLLTRGAIPFVVDKMDSSSSEFLISLAMEKGKVMGLCKTGSLIVVTSGTMEHVAGGTNSLRVISCP